MAKSNSRPVRSKSPPSKRRSKDDSASKNTNGSQGNATIGAGSASGVAPVFPAVRVRMYRQGLGDCFLVTFHAGTANERYMLIDSGTLGSITTGVKMNAVADDIATAIGKRGRLDLVVVTHEHKDHVSGFNGPMQRFRGRVDHVWLAWTENPDDKDARAMAKGNRDLGVALAKIARAAPATATSAEIADLLEFAGAPGAGEDFAFAETIDAAMDFVRSELGGITSYHSPGDLIEPEWLPGFRFYVLGPPRSQDRLKDMGGEGRSSDLYTLTAGLRATASAIEAAAAGGKAANPCEAELCDLQEPFDRRFARPEVERDAAYPAYADPAARWRAIDEDWIRVVADFALQLDTWTNNTSLVLAIERVADGKVLLFAADAQQGNWLSWHDESMAWTVRGDEPNAPTPGHRVTAKDLLARTVFYKVGHHASHNATAKEAGLELMMNADALTAFIPVDRAAALRRNPKGSWRMPARALYRRLLERCQGRVARSDIGWAADPQELDDAQREVEGEELTGLASRDSWQAYRRAQKAAEEQGYVTIDRKNNLFIEYTLLGFGPS